MHAFMCVCAHIYSSCVIVSINRAKIVPKCDPLALSRRHARGQPVNNNVQIIHEKTQPK